MATFALQTLEVVKCPVKICPTIIFPRPHFFYLDFLPEFFNVPSPLGSSSIDIFSLGGEFLNQNKGREVGKNRWKDRKVCKPGKNVLTILLTTPPPWSHYSPYPDAWSSNYCISYIFYIIIYIPVMVSSRWQTRLSPLICRGSSQTPPRRWDGTTPRHPPLHPPLQTTISFERSGDRYIASFLDQEFFETLITSFDRRNFFCNRIFFPFFAIFLDMCDPQCVYVPYICYKSSLCLLNPLPP